MDETDHTAEPDSGFGETADADSDSEATVELRTETDTRTEDGTATAMDEGAGEALVESLFAENVLTTDERIGAVTTSAEFEDTHEIYLDTYTSVPQSTFVDTVAEVFGLDATEATDRIDELGVTREQLAAYLALRSVLGNSYDVATLSRMAVVVAGLEPETPVPEGLDLLDDDTYEGFLASHGRAIVTVWKRRCDPCEAMKRDLDAVLSALPDEVAVAGVDGERSRTFCTEYDIDAAPAVVYFDDGSHRRTIVGRQPPERIGAVAESVYE